MPYCLNWEYLVKKISEKWVVPRKNMYFQHRARATAHLCEKWILLKLTFIEGEVTKEETKHDCT